MLELWIMLPSRESGNEQSILAHPSFQNENVGLGLHFEEVHTMKHTQ